MTRSEDQTRRELIDPKLRDRGWTEDLIRRERTVRGAAVDNLPLQQFPTPGKLRARYEALKGYSLSDARAEALLMPYKGGEAARWYFQDAAIRAALEKIVQGGNRVLLSLATGTGKAQLLFLQHIIDSLADGGTCVHGD